MTMMTKIFVYLFLFETIQRLRMSFIAPLFGEGFSVCFIGSLCFLGNLGMMWGQRHGIVNSNTYIRGEV